MEVIPLFCIYCNALQTICSDFYLWAQFKFGLPWDNEETLYTFFLMLFLIDIFILEFPSIRFWNK